MPYVGALKTNSTKHIRLPLWYSPNPSHTVKQPSKPKPHHLAIAPRPPPAPSATAGPIGLKPCSTAQRLAGGSIADRAALDGSARHPRAGFGPWTHSRKVWTVDEHELSCGSVVAYRREVALAEAAEHRPRTPLAQPDAIKVILIVIVIVIVIVMLILLLYLSVTEVRTQCQGVPSLEIRKRPNEVDDIQLQSIPHRIPFVLVAMTHHYSHRS